MEHAERFKFAVDGAGVLAIIGALFDHMPGIAAFASFVWFCIRIYESKTVQRRLRRRSR